MHFQIDDGELQSYFAQWENIMQQKVFQGAENLAMAMEEKAKENAPWQDQSGRARGSISGEVLSYGESGFQIILKGDTPYFSYLEFAEEGKFSILWPTVLASAEDLLYLLY